MFCRSRRYRAHRFGRFDETAFGGPFGSGRRWGRGGNVGFRRRRRTPTAVRILLAGLLVFAFVKLTSAINGSNRSTAEKIALGALIAVVGAALLSMRSSAQRYRW